MMEADSSISTIKVLSPCEMLSLAPTRVNILSTTPIWADEAGTNAAVGTDTGTATPDGGAGPTGVGTEAPADGPAEPSSDPGFDPSHADPARLAEVVGDEVAALIHRFYTGTS